MAKERYQDDNDVPKDVLCVVRFDVDDPISLPKSYEIVAGTNFGGGR
jgi:hypothetical protein